MNGIITAGGRTYSYKSTAISTFSVRAGSMSFASKCILKDITDPANVISLDSGNVLQLSVTDGAPDRMAVSIQRSSSLGGGLWYASGWDRGRSVEKPVSGGNITIAP